MKIGIDARTIIGKRAGKGQYTYNLIKALTKIDKKNRYLLYFSKQPSVFDFQFPDNFKIKVISWPSLFWHLITLVKLKKDKIDLFLAPTSYIIPALGFKKSVVVVHDLFSFFGLTSHQKKATLIERFTAERAFRQAEKIIAISENTKNDLINLFRINPNKISVVYLGVDQQFVSNLDKDKIDQILKKHKLPKEFFLFVSTLEPRKNVVRLIKAYHRLVINSWQLTTKLVIVGQKGWNYQEIFDTVDKLNLKDRVIFADYIKNRDLPYLYNQALAFVFPSLYEGFGLPVLEAMACGCPVITSNISSLPEIGSDAVLYVDPYNIDEIAGAMKEILVNKEMRKKLKEKGLRQAKNFSWEKTAKETLKILEKI